jgi:hypothetical protein
MRPRVRPRVARCAFLALGLPALASAAPRVGGRVEAGAEYDSNPGRAEEVDGGPERRVIGGSPLGRLVASGELAAGFGESQLLSLSAGVAGKAFTHQDARGENVVVGEAAGSYGGALGGRVRFSIGGSYYDVFQARRPESRDFRSLAPFARLELAVGEGGTLGAGAGYRSFTYKPDPSFDFAGPTGVLDYRHLWPGAGPDAADWEMAAVVSAEARGFSGTRCTGVDACPAPPEAGLRRDQFVVAQMEATRAGGFLLGAGVSGHLNVSNSYGESLLRGLVHARGVLLLPLSFSLSGRAELVLTRYRESVPLARNLAGQPFVSIEDESRSTVRLELVRPLGPHVDLGLRYTLYGDELAAGPVHYRRQTGLFFLALLL